MRLLVVALALLLLPIHANATWYPPPPVKPPVFTPGGTCTGCWAGPAGFIGFVGALVLYDIWRRNNCAGDVLGLGGPGFSSPSDPTQTTMLTVKDRGLCGRPKAIRVRG